MTDPGSRGQALVTGAVRRIGRAIVLRLAQDGYDVALHCSPRSRDETQALAESIVVAGRKAKVVVGDLRDAATPEHLLRSTGPVTLLVNNASLFEADTPDDFDVDFFDRAMAVNLRAPCALASVMARTLAVGTQGAVVNVVDQRVWRLNPTYFSYTLTKAALWAATQTMAQAFAPRVRVNAVGPGPVLPNSTDGTAGFQHEAANIPLGRAVEPEEIADAVAWLAAARSVTGQMIAVDGGQHVAWRTPDVVV